MFQRSRTAKQAGEAHGLFRIKDNITTGLTLVVLLVTMAACVRIDITNPLNGEIDADADSEESIQLRSGTGNPVAGREKSKLCQGCHGEYGISTEPLIPKLAGQYGPYIAKELRNYQSGVRTHQIMNAMAATINDDDLDDISAYFASQTKMKGNGLKNPVGKKLFLHGDVSRRLLPCVNCHGMNGKGRDPKISMFPVIGGQHKDYLRTQLINFREGDRTNSPNSIMNKITKLMTDAEIEALAEYAAAQ